VLAVVIATTRPFIGRLSDRLGHRRILLPCFALIVAGYGLLTVTHSTATFVVAAGVFAVGFGSAYPAFAAFVMTHVESRKRAAAYGSIIAAFDTGIGTGSVSLGWLVEHVSFEAAFGVAAVVAALSIPYFYLWAEPRFLAQTQPEADALVHS
jgi:MFS family permease